MIGDKDTENQVLLLEHDVPNYPFPQSVIDCLPSLPWIISDEEKKKRLDLTHLQICSVDPPGCTDIDDALHCIELENGNYQCGVHIADVSHFIRPSTAIDDEARRRSTTVYLVDKRIDMVPALLSSNLCSLRDDGPRLVVLSYEFVYFILLYSSLFSNLLDSLLHVSGKYSRMMVK